MYRLGLWFGLGFVWGLRLQISLIYEYIYIYIWALNIIYIYSGKPETVHRYWPVSEIYRTAGQTDSLRYGIDSLDRKWKFLESLYFMMGDLGWYSLTKPPPSHSDERERWANNWGENFMQCWGKSRGQFLSWYY